MALFLFFLWFILETLLAIWIDVIRMATAPFVFFLEIAFFALEQSKTCLIIFAFTLVHPINSSFAQHSEHDDTKVKFIGQF